MKTALKNNSWITTIAFALIEFPIIIFLSYFSLGSKDDIMEIYHSDPSRIIFIRGCISFVITSFLMSLIMLLYVIIKRILLNVRVTRKKIFISLDKEKYNRFLTAIVLSNKKDEEMEKTYKKVINKMVDDFIESVDFYDLTEKDINTIAEMFDEIV